MADVQFVMASNAKVLKDIAHVVQYVETLKGYAIVAQIVVKMQ
jgi:hypothetical protein